MNTEFANTTDKNGVDKLERLSVLKKLIKLIKIKMLETPKLKDLKCCEAVGMIWYAFYIKDITAEIRGEMQADMYAYCEELYQNNSMKKVTA